MPVIPSLLLGIFVGYLFTYFPLTVIASLSILLTFVFKNNKALAILLTVSLILGILYVNITKKENTQEPENISFTGYVKNKTGSIYEFKVVNSNSETKKSILKVYSKEHLNEGQTYKIDCIISDKYLNLYKYESFLCSLKTAQLAEQSHKTTIEEIREKINKKITEILNKNISGTLTAMTTGDRLSIPLEIKEDFKKTGLIHLLSISGAHFSLLFTVSFLIFKFIITRLPYTALVRLVLYIKPSQLSIILSFPIILSYFLIVEPNYPSTRAFFMATLFMIGVLSERKSLWIFTVSVACLVILIFEPQAIKDISFQLSFLATAGIGFASDFYKKFSNKINNRIISYIILSLLISVSATLITAPMIIYKFHYISLISPLSNLTAGILIGMVLFPLHLFFIGMFLVTGYYPVPELINFIGAISFKLTHWLASFKYSSVWIPPVPVGTVAMFYAAVFVLLLSFYALKKGKILCYSVSFILFLLSIFIPALIHIKDKEILKITFLDVGQAESTVLKTPYGFFLIDTGKTGWEATQHLKAYGVEKLILILTHEQIDHAGGFERILKNFQIREIWKTGYIDYNKELSHNISIRHLERGDVLKIGSCSFTILHPYKGFLTSSLSKESNELSLVFTLKCFKNTYLFTSDVGVEALQSIPLNYLKSEIIKIPHHGSKYSFYPAIYQYIKPEICIISVGKHNPYGHPHKEVEKSINKICKVYRTDEDGAIQIKESPEGTIKVHTIKDTLLKPYRDWENLKKLFILW